MLNSQFIYSYTRRIPVIYRIIHNFHLNHGVQCSSLTQNKLQLSHNSRVVQKHTKIIVKNPKKLEKPDCFKLRPPIITIMGHVDHGKTTLLDTLRAMKSVDKEFGGITQHLAGFTLNIEEMIKKFDAQQIKNLKSSYDYVTFIDTPGHATFSTLRMRGASVTDLIILIVAADDGVMPQTIESIECAKKHDCPIIVAINKIDRPGYDRAGIISDLASHDIVVEELGGSVQCVEISALKGLNIDKLFEAILLQSEFLSQSLLVDHACRFEGVVIESRIQHGVGKVASCVISKGKILRPSERGPFVAGLSICKPKIFFDDNSMRIHDISIAPVNRPGFMVDIAGWSELPIPGEIIKEVENDAVAMRIIGDRKKVVLEKKMKSDSKIQTLIKSQTADPKKEEGEKSSRKRKKYTPSLILDDVKINRDMTDSTSVQISSNDERIPIKAILKCDVEGSREAIINMLATIPQDDVKLELVSSGVGPLTTNEIENAVAFNAIVALFNVGLDAKQRSLIEEKKLKLMEHNVVYHLANEFKSHINASLPIVLEPCVIGTAFVKQIFEMKVKKTCLYVQGCKCVKGNLVNERNQKLSYEPLKDQVYYRVFRQNQETPLDNIETLEISSNLLDKHFYIHAENLVIKSLKHKKNDLDKVKENTECGLILGKFVNGNVDDFRDVKEGDVIECYRMHETKKELDWFVDFMDEKK